MRIRWSNAVAFLLIVLSTTAVVVRCQTGARRNERRSYASEFNPARQKPVADRFQSREVHLETNTTCESCPGSARLTFSFRDVPTQPIRRFVLENETAQVDELYLLPSTKVAVVGRVLPNTSIVTVLDLRTGAIVDSFYCFDPSVSKDRKKMAYVKVYPAHFVEGVSAQYMVYDFMRSAAENRPKHALLNNKIDVGFPVYPPGSLNRSGDNMGLGESLQHGMASSGFFWLESGDHFSFADRSAKSVSVVLVDISGGLTSPRVTTVPLPVREIVSEDRCPDFKDRLEFAFHVTEIRYPSDKDSSMEVRFSSLALTCLQRDHLLIPFH